MFDAASSICQTLRIVHPALQARWMVPHLRHAGPAIWMIAAQQARHFGMLKYPFFSFDENAVGGQRAHHSVDSACLEIFRASNFVCADRFLADNFRNAMKHNRSYGVAEPGLTEDVVEFVSRSDFWFGRGEDAPCIQGGYFVVHHMHPPVIFNQVIEKPNRLCYDCQMATKTTRSAILDVAEHHFAYYGYEATSLRAIMKDAGVNIAAINYHFGAKEELSNATDFATIVKCLPKQRVAPYWMPSSSTSRITATKRLLCAQL